MAFRGEEQDLYELLGNLIDNAGKSARQRVVVDVQLSQGQLCLTVDDDGPGIPEAEVERMRRPFTRLEKARTNTKGAGLGLAIVDEIVRVHGAQLVFAQGSHGRGLRVSVVFALVSTETVLGACPSDCCPRTVCPHG